MGRVMGAGGRWSGWDSWLNSRARRFTSPTIVMLLYCSYAEDGSKTFAVESQVIHPKVWARK